MLSSLKDIRQYDLPCFPDADGLNGIVVAEGQKEIPFVIARLFTISSNKGLVRGRHAHRECHQVLVCAEGKAVVVLKDGRDCMTITLSAPEEALYVPPGIWLELCFKATRNILNVFCDRVYEENDYLRNYDDFLHFRGS